MLLISLNTVLFNVSNQLITERILSLTVSWVSQMLIWIFFSSLESCNNFLYMHKVLYKQASTCVDGARRGETDWMQPLPQSHRASIPWVCQSSKINPSTFCPHVLTKHWIISWSTPYSQSIFNDLINSFPETTINSWRFVMQSSVSEDTLQNYRAGLLCFTQFCDIHRVPEVSRMPASETLLSIFVAEMGAGKKSASSIHWWLSGLAFWYLIFLYHVKFWLGQASIQYNNAPWMGGKILARTKKGTANLSAKSLLSLPHHLPVTEAHMKALHLTHGVEPWIVIKQGHWSSKAFLLYWHNIEDILPLFISDSLYNFSSLKSSIKHLQSM